jgi:hypothetical protein
MATFQDGNLVIHDVAGNTEHRVAPRDPASLATAETYKAHLLAATKEWFDDFGQAPSTLHEEEIDGERVWVIERTTAIDPGETFSVAATPRPGLADALGNTSGALSYTLPYTADLDLVERKVRWIIRQGDFLLQSEEVIGVDAQGQDRLLESREVTVYEVVPQ